MCIALNEIYQKVYNTAFDFTIFDCRILLQKAVYALENMGIHVGDYSFTLDKRGPYSLALDIEASELLPAESSVEVKFSEDAEVAFKKLQQIVSVETDYSQAEWMECVTTLHYLSKVRRINSSKLFSTFKSLKPHLGNDEENSKAFKQIQMIRV